MVTKKLQDRKYEVIYCDLDGTLLDDKERHYRCYEAIIQKYGGHPISSDEYWKYKRSATKRTVLLKKSEFMGTYDDYMEMWYMLIESDEILKYEKLKPGALNALAWMRKRTKMLCLISMRQSAAQLERQLQTLNIRFFFDEIIKGDPKRHKKSELVCNKHGDKALVIGDTEEDEKLAEKINAHFIAITSGLRERKFFCNAEAFVDSWNDFLRT